MKFSNLFFSVFFALALFGVQQIFAEGGGGVDCPEDSGVFSYIPGSAIYTTNSFEGGEIGVLFCEYETESEEVLEPFGEINAIFHVNGDLSQDLIDEYGCGAVLGKQYSSTYVISGTHFASVAYSIDQLGIAAGIIMAQIENENLASVCVANENQTPIAEVVEQVIEEHEEIEETKVPESVLGEITIQESITEFEIILPNWIKNNAGWWSSGQITDLDFADGIAYLIKQGYIQIPPTETSEIPDTEIPEWVKNNAEWWSEDQISDEDFVNGLQFLISNGIIIA